MVNARHVLVATLFVACAQAQAQTVLDVIDIRPIAAQAGGGNVAGLGFVPEANVLYVAARTVIYTIDLDGNVLAAFDLEGVQPGHLPESFAYDTTTGHLFVAASFYPTPDADPPEWRLLELDPPAFSVLANRPFDFGVGLNHVEEHGLWGAFLAEDILRRYTRAGALVESLSVAASFPGFAGPIDLAASLSGGFFVLDSANERIVEIDRSGRELNATPIAGLGTGSALQIDSDIVSRRIFLQVNNDDIFVLSTDALATPMPVAIDFRPGGHSNSVNPRSKGRVAVAVLTTRSGDTFGQFDATTVDLSTVRLGATTSTAQPVHHTFADLDADGDGDLLLHFRTQDVAIGCEATSVALTAETYGGQRIRGTDVIRVVGCR